MGDKFTNAITNLKKLLSEQLFHWPSRQLVSSKPAKQHPFAKSIKRSPTLAPTLRLIYSPNFIICLPNCWFKSFINKRNELIVEGIRPNQPLIQLMLAYIRTREILGNATGDEDQSPEIMSIGL